MLLAHEVIAEPRFPARQSTLDLDAQNETSSVASDPIADAMRTGRGVNLVRELETRRPTARIERPRGNPLWAITLESLSMSRERPIFLPSRRRPSPVAVAPAPPEPNRNLPPATPEYPHLTLLGSVTGQTDSLAVFMDQGERSIVRLRTGEDHRGWTLRAIREREAIFQKGRETIIFSFPGPDQGWAAQASSGVVTPAATSNVRGAPDPSGIARSPTGVPGRMVPR